MKKILLVCLFLTCLYGSSVYAEQSKIPVEVLVIGDNKVNTATAIQIGLGRSIENSLRYRLTDREEDRFQIRITALSVTSNTMELNSYAFPVHLYSVIWVFKPKNKLPYYFYQKWGEYVGPSSIKELFERTNQLADTLLNKFGYLLNQE